MPAWLANAPPIERPNPAASTKATIVDAGWRPLAIACGAYSGRHGSMGASSWPSNELFFFAIRLLLSIALAIASDAYSHVRCLGVRASCVETQELVRSR